MFLQERHGDQRPQLQTGRRTEPCLTAPEEDQGTPGIHPFAYNHNDDTFHFFLHMSLFVPSLLSPLVIIYLTIFHTSLTLSSWPLSSVTWFAGSRSKSSHYISFRCLSSCEHEVFPPVVVYFLSIRNDVLYSKKVSSVHCNSAWQCSNCTFSSSWDYVSLMNRLKQSRHCESPRGKCWLELMEIIKFAVTPECSSLIYFCFCFRSSEFFFYVCDS